MAGMRTSREGAGMIMASEAIILEAYPDPGTGGDPWTIGAGHTSRAGGPSVKPGDIWPFQKAIDELANDLARNFEPGVNRAIKVPMRQHQFDAAVSFHLNTGAIATGTVDDRWNAGNIDGALATWARYNRAGGRVMPGLVKRREEEIAVFRTGRYPSRKILVKDRRNSTGRLMDPAAIAWRGSAATKPALSIDLPPPIPAKSPVKTAPAPTWWGWLKGLFS